MISVRLELMERGIKAARIWSPLATVELPMRLSDRANGRSAVTRLAGARKTKAVRDGTCLACLGWRRMDLLTSVVAVRIVRVAPRELDDDNAVSACKPVRDGVADALGINDRDKRVVWLVDQERGSPHHNAVRIEVYRVS